MPRGRSMLTAAVAITVAAGVSLGACDSDHADDQAVTSAVTSESSSGPPPSPAASSSAPGQASPTSTTSTTPVQAIPALYVDRTGAAARQLQEYRNAGQTAKAALIAKIANRPTATWFADSSPGTASRAQELVRTAGEAGKIPVLTLYNIPHRDCSGQHSAGGAASAVEYRSWIAAIAKALEDHAALVILEPDAVAQAVQGCLNKNRTKQRYDLISYAVSTLRRNARTRVYLDAGNPTWITDTTRLATALRQAGIERGNGFSLNVANFETTRANITYGTELSGRLGGARFVVDTSRNGNGPASRGSKGNQQWCNPSGRKLGDPPTTRTGNGLVDAYLWVKRPGESDGACGNGAPAAGQWWSQYALELAR